MRVVGLDPGLRHCGVSLVVEGELAQCCLVSAPGRVRDAEAWLSMEDPLTRAIVDMQPDVLAYEMMEAYSGNSQAKNEALLQLCGVLGATVRGVRLEIPGVRLVALRPKEWKGQVKKVPHHKQLLGSLSAAEKAALNAGCVGVRKDLQHNVLDAVGVGKFHAVGKIRRRRLDRRRPED